MEFGGSISVGARVRVRQQIVKGSHGDSWSGAVEGTVVRQGPAKTGSWYARGKDDRLWLSRIWLRKDNGEETCLVLDRHSLVEIL
jgi:hypothetical protein